MSFTVEAGKYCKNANGEKVGPMRKRKCSKFYDVESPHKYGHILWHYDGIAYHNAGPDLVSEWQDEPETRLLKDWNPQEGDVFAHSETKREEPFTNGRLLDCVVGFWVHAKWSLVSRANATPRTFGELSDAEKGALLLAHHEGRILQTLDGESKNWMVVTRRHEFGDNYYYRIAPTRITGTVEIDADGNPLFDTWEAEV